MKPQKSLILLKDHSCKLLAVHVTAIWIVTKEGFHMLTDLRPAICSLISSHQTTCLQCGLQCCLPLTCPFTHLLRLVSVYLPPIAASKQRGKISHWKCVFLLIFLEAVQVFEWDLLLRDSCCRLSSEKWLTANTVQENNKNRRNYTKL